MTGSGPASRSTTSNASRAIRRRTTYWSRVAGAIFPRVVATASGSTPALALAGVAVVSTVTGLVVQPNSPIWVVVAVASIALAIAEASFHEWDRWAPSRPPRLHIERQDWEGYAGVLVRNDDIDGTFRARVIDVRGPDGNHLRWGPSEIWPLALGWGDQLAPEVHLVRGETAKIHIVGFKDRSLFVGTVDGRTVTPPKFEYRFIGPNETGHTLPMLTPDGSKQDAIEVVIEYVRSAPEPSRLVQSERIEFPRPHG